MPQAAETPAQRIAVLRTMREQLAAIPGVQSVGVVSRLPLLGSNLGAWLFVEGKYLPGEPGYDVEYRVASPNYFETMGIPLRAGRLFDEHDDANPSAGMLINETAARKFWPGEDPIGKRVKLCCCAAAAPRVPPVLPSPRGVPLFCCSAFHRTRPPAPCIGRFGPSPGGATMASADFSGLLPPGCPCGSPMLWTGPETS